MASERNRRRPGVEALEGRLSLSGYPFNTIGVAQGAVPAPRSVGLATTQIPPRSLALHKATTLYSVFTQPNPGSPLQPSVVTALGPTGRPLHFRAGAPFLPGRHAEATGYVQSGQPGPLTVGITGRRGTIGTFTTETALPGDILGTGQVTLADLQAFAAAFPSHAGDAYSNPAADANRNGFIGQGDARFLERNITPLTPKVPIQIELHLAPGEQIKHPGLSNSGGITDQANITILGKTTPLAIVFVDDTLGDFAFNGSAVPADAQGNFQVKAKLTGALTNFEFLVIDPYGQQKIAAFPVLYTKAIDHGPTYGPNATD
jgi:hypothetical protein